MKKIILLFIALLFIGLGNTYSQKLIAIERDSFSLKYPSTWTIDKADEDYDPDALFSLDSPEEGETMMFMIFNMVIDADEMLTEQVKTMTKNLIKNPSSITAFDTWGKYSGKGKIIKGKIMGLFKGQIKLFMYTDKSKSMLIMEQLYDSNIDKLGADFKSIADSFTFK
jgi:hypothetical protein